MQPPPLSQQQSSIALLMSGKPSHNATTTITLKRKRAPIWPCTTRSVLEQGINILIETGTVEELSPPDEWRIHPSTEARGSGFHHERRVRGINDSDQWFVLKIRQHSQDPSRTTARTGFEGGQVSNLNSDLAQLLRSLARSGGRPRAVNPTSINTTGEGAETRNVRTKPSPTSKGKQADNKGEGNAYTSGSPPSSTNRAEEEAASATTTHRSGTPCATQPGTGLPTLHRTPPHVT
jgi:hypothetical protein